MAEADPVAALAHIAAELFRLRRAFAVVGGLAVSVRAGLGSRYMELRSPDTEL
jgi:hypothetical protein